MRPQYFLVLCALVVLACAWTKEDHEIFRLRDEVEASEGVDVTFYDFLGVTPTATYEDLQKAFRKKSRALHPDKVKHSFIASRSTGKPKPKKSGGRGPAGVHVSKGPSQREIEKFVKEATERYGRLGVVADILKGQSRDRYDHFLKNGFPKWRGTGYYYTRFRPGLGSVLVGLFIFGGGLVHYGALVLGWRRQRDFVDRYVRHARKSAWGDETGVRGIPGLGGSVAYTPPPPTEVAEPTNLNRRQKREMERQNKKESKSGKASRAAKTAEDPTASAITTPSGERRRVVAENGKILVVDSMGNVFLEEEDDDGNVDEFLLDINEIPRPTFRDTAVYRLPMWMYHKTFGLFLKRPASIPPEITVKEEEKAELDHTTSQDPSQDSGDSFELVDSTGLEKEMGVTKKRGKKGKK
jgi:DnaJ domain